MDLQSLQITPPLPDGITEQDIFEYAESNPTLRGRILVVQCKKKKAVRMRKLRFEMIYRPMMNWLKDKINGDWDPARSEVAAYNLLEYAATVNRENTQAKLLGELHKILGHNNSTIKIKPDMLPHEFLQKWRAEIEARAEVKSILSGMNGADHPGNA